jgi:hypothetical protein
LEPGEEGTIDSFPFILHFFFCKIIHPSIQQYYSSTMASCKNNTCIICLESLLTATEDDHDEKNATKDNNDRMCDFGACSPCGHPVHESCFRQWATFHNSDKSEKNKSKIPGIPCPTCHKETTSFVKIYLRAEEKESTTSSDDDDDDDEETEVEKCQERTFGPCDKLKGQALADGTLSQPQSSSDNAKPTASSQCASSARNKNNCNNKKSNHKEPNKNTTRLLYKKKQWYKKQYLGKCEQVKILKLEAQNRQQCHHDDLVGLERSQRTNFRLAKELERTIETGRFCRNIMGFACFTVGWIISRKLTMGANGGMMDQEVL